MRFLENFRRGLLNAAEGAVSNVLRLQNSEHLRGMLLIVGTGARAGRVFFPFRDLVTVWLFLPRVE